MQEGPPEISCLQDVVPAQSPVPCGSPHGELAEPSAEPVADAFVDAVHEKVFELTQPEAGDADARARAGVSPAGEGPGAGAPRKHRRGHRRAERSRRCLCCCSFCEDSAGSEGAWKGPGAEQPEVPPKA